MSVRVTITIEQSSGDTYEHVANAPGDLVLPVLAKAVKSAVVAHEHEVKTISEMIHAITDAWVAAG